MTVLAKELQDWEPKKPLQYYMNIVCLQGIIQEISHRLETHLEK